MAKLKIKKQAKEVQTIFLENVFFSRKQDSAKDRFCSFLQPKTESFHFF
jgi:hypothetical protein